MHEDEDRVAGPDASIGHMKARSKLKSEGGKGQAGIGIIDGAVLTLKENAALVIARDVIDNARRANNGKPAGEIPLIELAKYAKGRAKPGICTDAAILAEICRLQNAELYQGKLARR